MKDKLLIGTAAFFLAIFTSIIMLNISESSSNTNNYFDRVFSNKQILIFNKEFSKLNKNSIGNLYCSNDCVIEEEFIGNREKNKISKFYFTDYSFLNRKSRELELPSDSYNLLVDTNCVIYSYKKKLYNLNFKTNTSSSSPVKDIDVYFMISLDSLTNKYLFFGEVYKYKTYKAGFFILDFKSGEVSESKILETNKKSSLVEFVTMHSGRFQRMDNNLISYSCDKNSNVFLFEYNGFFKNAFDTKDKTSLPKIVRTPNGDYTYSRNGLKFSNAGLFMDKNNIYAFSIASKHIDKFIIDQYDKSNFEYIKSFKLNFNDYSSSDINNVYIHKDKIILKLKTSYLSFRLNTVK